MTQKLAIGVNTVACTGCRRCEMVCTLFHENVVNPEKARIRVSDNYDQFLFEPHICQQCEPAHCVEACPLGALTQNATGAVIVDDDLCNGCEACVQVCPHNAIWWSEELERLFICDRCGGQPICVQFCTPGALQLASSS